MKRDNPLLAWHASPFDLPAGKFGPMEETSGKGQGAASYGRGAAYLAENPKVSGPGESEYMQEFQRHPAVGPTDRAWHIKADEGWEKLDDDFHDLSTPDIMYDTHVSGLSKTEAGRDWIAQYLNQRHGNPKAIDHLAASLKSSDDAFAEYMNNEGEIGDDEEQRYTPDHARMVRRAMATVDKHFKYGDGTAKGPFSYRVAVHTGEENLLDWDAPLKDHHKESYQKLRSVIPADVPVEEADPNTGEIYEAEDHTTGQNLYQVAVRKYKSDFAASKALYNAGIHGIRYKDQGSRQNNRARTLFLDGQPVDPAEFTKHGSAADHPDEDLRNAMILASQANLGHPDLAYTAKMMGLSNWKAGKAASEWYAKNKHRVDYRHHTTYNYVVFHPDLLETLAQYNIKGEKTKDYGPGVHLKAVEHDPFEGEDR